MEPSSDTRQAHHGYLRAKLAAWTLSRQFGVLLVATLTFTLVVGSIVLFNAAQEHVIEMNQGDRVTKIGLIQVAVLESVITEDVPVLEETIRQMVELDDRVIRIEIRNEQDIELVTWEHSEAGLVNREDALESVIEFGGETFGTLSATWDDTALHADTLLHLAGSLKFFVGGVLMMGLLFFLMLRRLAIKPMSRIASRLNDIAEGHLDGRLPGSTSRELTLLSKAVDDLGDALAEKQLAHERMVRTSASLETLQKKSELVLNTTAEGIVGLDHDGRVEFINKAALEMIGCTRNQALGLPIMQLVHIGRPEDVPIDEEDTALIDSLEAGQVVRVDDGTFWRWNRRSFPVSYSSTPILDKGKLAGAVVVFRDEIASRQAQTEQRLAAITFDSQELIMITDPNGLIMRVNKAFTEATGYDEQEAIGRNAGFQKSGLHDTEFYRSLWSSLKANGRWEGELWNRRKDGEVYPLWYAISAVRNEANETTNYVSHAIDISEIRQVENELRSAMVKAEAANRAKDEFLATMSHEMRTPLNAVLGMLGLLQDENLPPRLRGYLRTARDAGEGLLDLIGDVLDFSKMDAGMLDLEMAPFNLTSVVENVSALLGQRAREKGLELNSDYDPEIHHYYTGDAGRLRQVLLNLAVNAIKFTEDGSVSLRLIVKPGEERQVLARFEVTDTGIGISTTDQKVLFDEFSTIDNSYARSHEGAGLGLAISRRLVELMGGQIGVESSPGVGSRFWFEVPLNRCEPPRYEFDAQASDTDLDSSHRARILLAEDVVANRQLAKEMLERAGHTVDIVANGAEAIEAVGSIPYDLVLMDISMPGMDGIEATRRIRGMQSGVASIPIVAMTAHAMKGDREAFLEAGMDEYIQKPINREVLLQVAARYGQLVDAPKSSDQNSEVRSVMTKHVSQQSYPPKSRIDQATLEQLGLDTSPDLVPELIALFIEDAKGRIDRIAAALEADDLAVVDHEVHALGSSSGTYGLPEMHQLARRCEEALREGEEGLARELASALVDTSTQDFHALEEHASLILGELA